MSKFKVGDIVIHTKQWPEIRSLGPKKIYSIEYFTPSQSRYYYLYLDDSSVGFDIEDNLEFDNKALIKEMMGVK